MPRLNLRERSLTAFEKRIIELFNENQSYAAMEKLTGRSRGTISGTITRLKEFNFLPKRDIRGNRKAAVTKPALPPAAPAETAVYKPIFIKPNPAPEAIRAGGFRECQWPFGEPGREGFHFCGCKDVLPGRPYCAEHYVASRVKPYGKNSSI